MEIKLDGTINPELKDFLLSQEGITNVEIDYDDYFIKLNVKFNEKTNPNIVMKYMVVFVLCKNGVVRKDRGASLTAAKKGQPWLPFSCLS